MHPYQQIQMSPTRTHINPYPHLLVHLSPTRYTPANPFQIPNPYPYQLIFLIFPNPPLSLSNLQKLPHPLLPPIHLIPWLPVQKTSSPNRKSTRMARSDTRYPRRSSPLLTAPSQNPRATPWLPRAVNGVKP
jgi:hypothetical protein